MFSLQRNISSLMRIFWKSNVPCEKMQNYLKLQKPHDFFSNSKQLLSSMCNKEPTVVRNSPAASKAQLRVLSSCSISKTLQVPRANTTQCQVPSQGGTMCPLVAHSSVRTHMADWRQLKDQRKRRCVSRYGAERLRINALRRNKVLPEALRQVANADVIALPRDSNYIRTRGRCVVTSRPRGIMRRWRVSRIIWRNLADYNQFSGVIRAKW